MDEPRIDGPRTEPPGELRIGDAERDEAMAALREHFAQGRITSEELDERLESALRARTARDLRAITADLPDLHAADVRPFSGGRAGERPRHPAPWHHGPWHDGPRHHGPWGHGPWGHGPWGHPRWGATAGPPAPWRHSHGGPPGRPGPWGPPSRRPHRGHPPFPLVLLAVLVIVSVVTGTAWPLIFAVKALLFGMIAFAVIGMLRRRHRGGMRG